MERELKKLYDEYLDKCVEVLKKNKNKIFINEGNLSHIFNPFDGGGSNLLPCILYKITENKNGNLSIRKMQFDAYNKYESVFEYPKSSSGRIVSVVNIKKHFDWKDLVGNVNDCVTENELPKFVVDILNAEYELPCPYQVTQEEIDNNIKRWEKITLYDNIYFYFWNSWIYRTLSNSMGYAIGS